MQLNTELQNNKSITFFKGDAQAPKNLHRPKLLQIFTFYDHYLDEFYFKNIGLNLRSYREQLQAIANDGFASLHIFAPYLSKIGYEAEYIIANSKELQSAWAKENNYNFNQKAWAHDIVRQQIEASKPDIIYCLNPLDYDSKFFSTVEHKAKLLVGWRAADIPAGTDWTGYNLILSHLSTCREKAKLIGAKNSAHFFPGVPKSISESVVNQEKQFDVVFSGQYTPQHAQRNKFILELAQAADRIGFKLGLFLCSHHYELPAEIKKYNYGQRWGMDMYKALKSGKIVINAEIDLAQGEAGNLRLFETTAVGSFLLTEHQHNIEKYYKPGYEIETFKNSSEMIDKINFYLKHSERREEIAKNGANKANREFNMENQANLLDNILKQNLPELKSTSIVIKNEIEFPQPAPSLTKANIEVPMSPEEISAEIGKAITLFQNGEAVAALKITEKVKKQNISIPEFNYFRVLCLNTVGRHEEALEAAKEELKINPKHDLARAEMERLSRAIKINKPQALNPEQRSYLSKIDSATLHSIQNASHNYAYRGIPMIKNPFDMALYPLLIWNYKPKTIIEIGTKNGGSAVWFGDMLNNYGIDGHIYSLDIVKVEDVSHPRVTFIEGDGRKLENSFSKEWIESLPRPLLVIEDADHSYETTKAVLNFFSPYLQPNEYIIIEDGIISNLTNDPECNSGPHLGLKEFLSKHPGEYDMDQNYLDYFGYNFTWCTNGILKKKNYAINPKVSKEVVSEFLLNDPATSGIESQMSQNERFQLYGLSRKLVKATNNKIKFIEIGSHAGASLLLQWKALKKHNVQLECYAVEPHGMPQFYDVLKQLGSDVTHLKMFSDQAAQELRARFAQDGTLADYIFVDGDHTYQGVKSDIENYYPLLKSGGIMVFHDWLPEVNSKNQEAIFFHHGGKEPGIRQACAELMEQKYRCELLEIPLLYPTDPTQTQAHLPIIPEVFSTVRVYRKP